MSRSHILIVEGTAAVGKTTLCSALIREVASRERVPSLFNFRQSFTYHPLDSDHPSTFADDDRVKSHLDDFWSLVRRLSAWPGYILIESLHWTWSSLRRSSKPPADDLLLPLAGSRILVDLLGGRVLGEVSEPDRYSLCARYGEGQGLLYIRL